MSQNEFEKLRSELKEIKHFARLINLAVWDQQVFLPSGAADERGEQLGLLAKLRHDRMIADSLFDLVTNLSERSDLSPEQKIVVRETKDDLTRARRKPTALIAAIAEQETKSHAAWLDARSQNRFTVALPALNEFLRLKKEYAAALAPELSPYDALMDDFERGARSKETLDRFAILRDGMLQLRERFLKPQKNLSVTVQASRSEQEVFFEELATKIGFDFSRGRLDPTVHPFMSELGLNDVRLTTRFKEHNLFYGLFALLHEMGHGLYEQGLLAEWNATPLSEANSLAIHESQSLLYDKQIGSSYGFQGFLLEQLQQYFPTQTSDLTPERLFRDFNALSVDLNRLSSDEVGYALHIILRTELEERMLSGDLTLEDLPSAWAEKTERYFGRKPKDDMEGVLQDVHWYAGLWGYFPQYLGGTMYAAQLMTAFCAKSGLSMNSNGVCDESFFKKLLHWLRENVHHVGRSLEPEALIAKATGLRVDPKIYLNYLQQKYEFLETL